MNETIKQIAQFWNSLNKYYFCNFAVVASVLVAITIAFSVQFKVESLQDQMAETEGQIAFYQDQITLLEVEWTYLTRPERLRDLTSRYFKDNGYTLASQIKNSAEFDVESGVKNYQL